ncbi:MAG: hypothetical protein SFT91_05640 [Rickettsiaceae bacterium]|nr:hypothetical protein [Rickettsiaceae bacterium]
MSEADITRMKRRNPKQDSERTDAEMDEEYKQINEKELNRNEEKLRNIQAKSKGVVTDTKVYQVGYVANPRGSGVDLEDGKNPTTLQNKGSTSTDLAYIIPPKSLLKKEGENKPKKNLRFAGEIQEEALSRRAPRQNPGESDESYNSGPNVNELDGELKASALARYNAKEVSPSQALLLQDGKKEEREYAAFYDAAHKKEFVLLNSTDTDIDSINTLTKKQRDIIKEYKCNYNLILSIEDRTLTNEKDENLSEELGVDASYDELRKIKEKMIFLNPELNDIIKKIPGETYGVLSAKIIERENDENNKDFYQMKFLNSMTRDEFNALGLGDEYSSCLNGITEEEKVERIVKIQYFTKMDNETLERISWPIDQLLLERSMSDPKYLEADLISFAKKIKEKGGIECLSNERTKLKSSEIRAAASAETKVVQQTPGSTPNAQGHNPQGRS